MNDAKKEKLFGTDESFLWLMGIGGPAVLKLLGVASEKSFEFLSRGRGWKKKREADNV